MQPYLQCCNVEQKMNTVKSTIAENGRTANDRVVILDAGAQYGKVKFVILLRNCNKFVANRKKCYNFVSK